MDSCSCQCMDATNALLVWGYASDMQSESTTAWIEIAQTSLPGQGLPCQLVKGQVLICDLGTHMRTLSLLGGVQIRAKPPLHNYVHTFCHVHFLDLFALLFMLGCASQELEYIRAAFQFTWRRRTALEVTSHPFVGSTAFMLGNEGASMNGITAQTTSKRM